MTKSRKNSILKSVQKTSSKVLPVVDEGLQTVGSTAKDMAKISLPIVEKGVSKVYGTLATGFDLGIKGAKSVASGVSKMSKRKRSNHKTRRH